MDDESIKTDWNKAARRWIMACKIFIMIFIFGLMVTATFENVPVPYCIFLIGIEFALSLMVVFIFVRVSNTPKKRHRKVSQ
jgi:formate/nitrite transporter FocA (FNT family)